MPSKEEILEAVKNQTYAGSKVEISNQIVKADFISSLFLALNSNSLITHLGLSVCCLKLEEAQAVADGLINNSTIRVLRLNHNEIGDEGAKLIANAICRNKTLKSLYLTFNDIGEQGTKYLYNAACQNRSIINIDLNFDHPGDKILRPLMEENKLLRKKLALDFLTKAVTAAATYNMFDIVPNVADFLYGHGIFGQKKFWQKLQRDEFKLECKTLRMS